MSEILARVFRNERIESVHRGHLAVVNTAGKLIASAGDPAARTYIRSAGKPFQVIPLLSDEVDRHFNLTDEEIAVIIASHNGEADHVQAVQSIMRKVGLEESHLHCAFHLPMHRPSAEAHLLQDLPKSPVYNNCSGKHSGMLARARFHNWPLENYLDPEHPVQREILSVVAQFSGLPVEDIGIGIDGCSAPVFYMPVRNMALMYAKLANGALAPTDRIFEMMTSHPAMIAGSARFDTDFMRVTCGRMVSKIGAEGVRCLAVKGKPSLGVALKIEDGHKRASEAILLEVLKQLGLISRKELDQLLFYQRPVISNHAGLETGCIAVDFKLRMS
ncbi:MAG: asparaginase [bacterium]